MRIVLLVLLVVCAGALVASRFVPQVARIEVSGERHYAREDVLRLADVAPGDPFLWITSRRIRGLTRDPWIRSVRVFKHWPDTVSITVAEREPALTDGATTWAADGTVLTGVRPEEVDGLPRVEGWGSPRVSEALELLSLLQPYAPEVISYSPEGFEIQLTGTSLFTPSAEALREQWAAFESRRGGRVAVYPWGVSKAHE